MAKLITTRRLLPILALVVLAFVLVAPALAANPHSEQYGNVAGKEKTPPSSPSPLGPAHTSGTLPFTGLNIAIFFGASLLVIGGGFALRRAGRNTGEQQ